MSYEKNVELLESMLKEHGKGVGKQFSLCEFRERCGSTCATGSFVTGSFGQHHAVAYADVAAIGCELHPIDYWLEHGRKIGKENGYQEYEIDAYLAWLKQAKKVLREMNK